MGRAHDALRCSKRTCCRSGKGRFAAGSGQNSTGIFFSLHIYSSIQVVFYFFFVSRPVDSTRPELFYGPPHVFLLIVSSLAYNGSVGVAGELRHDGLVRFICSVCRTKTEREREWCVWYAPNFFLSGNAPGGAFCPIFQGSTR